MNYAIVSGGENPILNIYNIGFSDDKNITKFGPAKRDQYIIHYVLAGKGYFNGNEVKANQGFLITPELLHEYIYDEAEPWTYLWIISHDKRMKDIFKYLNADEKTLIFNFNFAKKLTEIGLSLKNKKIILPSLEILNIFIDIIAPHFEAEESKSAELNKETYLKFSENYIYSNISSALTVRELTKLLGVSQSYLYRIFKEKHGISTKRFISEVKIKKAKDLLKTTGLTVSQIAASVGFDDVLAFSKFFSKETGFSPTSYRK